jgi:hypothetical protein
LIQRLSQVTQDYQDGIFAGASNLIEVVTGTPAMTVDEFAIANKACSNGFITRPTSELGVNCGSTVMPRSRAQSQERRR